MTGAHQLETTEGGGIETWKESDRARGTYFLETTEGGTCQDWESKQPSKRHSLSGDHRVRDFLGHRKKVIKQGALTFWRPEGGTCQEKEESD